MNTFQLSLVALLALGCTRGDDKDQEDDNDGGWSNSNDSSNDGGGGTTPEAGVTYDGGERIYFPQYGLAFEIPSGWRGAMDEVDERSFVMSPSSSDAVAMVTAMRIDEADLKDAFSENLDLGSDIWMVPEDNFSESGNILSAPYDITGEQDGSTWKGYIAAVVGGHKWASIGLGIAPSGDKSTLVSAIDAIAESVTLNEPDEGADFTGNWEESLAGYTFTNYESGSDYSDKTRYTLCQDGSASYYSSTYSGGMTGSLSVSSAGEGTWEVEYASTDSVDVYFELTNDLSGTYEFTVDGDGKFYSNGYRYYREWNGC
jgi:hypothetical protein